MGRCRRTLADFEHHLKDVALPAWRLLTYRMTIFWKR